MALDLQPAPAPSADGREPTGTRRRRLVIGLVAVAVLAALVARWWWPGRAEDVRAGTDAVTMEQLADAHGIEIDLVAVTAANGLIELRYQVVDPDKATRILHEPELAPTLVAEDTGATLRMAAPPHKHGGELKLGGTYFFLMANAHTALHAGSRVTIVIGDTRVEHVLVQG